MHGVLMIGVVSFHGLQLIASIPGKWVPWIEAILMEETVDTWNTQ